MELEQDLTMQRSHNLRALDRLLRIKRGIREKLTGEQPGTPIILPEWEVLRDLVDSEIAKRQELAGSIQRRQEDEARQRAANAQR